MYNARITSTQPTEHIQPSHLKEPYTPQHQYYYSALKPPIVLPIRLNLRNSHFICVRPHNHPQQRLLRNRELIFCLYALNRIPSLASIPLRHLFFGAHVIVGWVVQGGEVHGAFGPVCGKRRARRM